MGGARRLVLLIRKVQDHAGAPRPPRSPARSQAEHDFLALGQGAADWLIAASAAEPGRFGEENLPAIITKQATTTLTGDLVVVRVVGVPRARSPLPPVLTRATIRNHPVRGGDFERVGAAGSEFAVT